MYTHYWGTPCITRSPEPPRMKRNVGIRSASETYLQIIFNANAGFAGEAQAFGEVVGEAPAYTLYVDARYDFQEVVNYLKSL